MREVRAQRNARTATRRPCNGDFAEYRRTRDRRQRDRLVEGHIGLAYSIARRFAGGREELEDLEQVALLALVQAVERFDPALGLSFSTFATPTITGTLKRHFRDRTWAVRPPRAVQERYLAVTAAFERLTGQLRRVPTTGEIAADGRWPVGHVDEALIAGRVHRQHDSLGAGDEDGDSGPGMIDDQLSGVELRVIVDQLLDGLGEDEREIIEMRFFEDLAQSTIGKRIGVSQMSVSRLLTATLIRLRCAATERALSPH